MFVPREQTQSSDLQQTSAEDKEKIKNLPVKLLFSKGCQEGQEPEGL